jgi:protein-S-isoprenylcysteine O-methyltransferase Ste14
MRALELKVPPPVVALACGAAIWQLARVLPPLAFDFPGRAPLAAAIALAGLSLDAVSLVRFVRQRTTANPLRPGNTRALVTGGLYRLTRNPMYLGLALVLTAWATYQGNAAGFAMLPVFVAYITRFQILPEERMLAAKFGAEYDAYRRAVRRWI